MNVGEEGQQPGGIKEQTEDSSSQKEKKTTMKSYAVSVMTPRFG